MPVSRDRDGCKISAYIWQSFFGFLFEIELALDVPDTDQYVEVDSLGRSYSCAVWEVGSETIERVSPGISTGGDIVMASVFREIVLEYLVGYLRCEICQTGRTRTKEDVGD